VRWSVRPRRGAVREFGARLQDALGEALSPDRAALSVLAGGGVVSDLRRRRSGRGPCWVFRRGGVGTSTTFRMNGAASSPEVLGTFLLVLAAAGGRRCRPTVTALSAAAPVHLRQA
jgi:hypothetical protein